MMGGMVTSTVVTLVVIPGCIRCGKERTVRGDT